MLEEDAWLWSRGFAALSGLSRLTRLEAELMDVYVGSGVWKAVAGLTGLQELQMVDMDALYVLGAAQLTSCQQLTHLHVNGYMGDAGEPAGPHELRIALSNQVRATSKCLCSHMLEHMPESGHALAMLGWVQHCQCPILCRRCCVRDGVFKI